MWKHILFLILERTAMNYLNLAKQHASEMVEDTQELLKIESLRDVNHKSEKAPFGPKIREALDVMLSKAQQDGFQVEDVDGYAGVISYGEGEESVSMLGHLDIVPIGEGWTKDPFGSDIVDGYLYGRGSKDDKGPTIAAYHALKVIKELNIPLKRKIMLILGTDEESGMSCMKYFKENYHTMPTMGFVPDADFPAIYGEKGLMTWKLQGHYPTIIQSMQAGERSNVVIGKASVTVEGKQQAKLFEIYKKQNNLEGTSSEKDGLSTYTLEGKYFHGSMPHRGINAAVHLLKFVGGAYDDKLSIHLGNLLSDPFGQSLNTYFKGSHMGELSMNVGIVNIKNDDVDIHLDVRYPHDSNAVELYENAQETVTSLNNKLSLVLCSNAKPHFVDPNSELVSTLMESYKKYSGDELTPALTMGGGTYARMLDNHVAFGPVFPNRVEPKHVGGPHEKDEAIEIESLVLATAIYVDALVKLAGK